MAHEVVRELTLNVTTQYAAIKVEPNPGEEADPNFPQNLHNAAELLLRVGHIQSAQRLQSCTARLFQVYSDGPDGSVTHSIGRACVCWGCGNVGLPRNTALVAERGSTPAGQCANCGEDGQTNFVRVTQQGEQRQQVVVPWIEVTSEKPVVALAAPKAQTGKAQPKPNSKCPCGSDKKAKKCCYSPIKIAS